MCIAHCLVFGIHLFTIKQPFCKVAEWCITLFMSISRGFRKLEWGPSSSSVVTTYITRMLEWTIPAPVCDAVGTNNFSTDEVDNMFLLSRVLVVSNLLRLEVVGYDTVRFSRLDLVWFYKTATFFMILMAGTTEFLLAFMSATPSSIHFTNIPYNSTF